MFGFGKRKRQDEAECAKRVHETVPEPPGSNSADLAAAFALDQALLTQSQAHGVLFANMVSEQQRQVTAAQAAIIKSTAEMIGVEPEKLAPHFDRKT